MNQSGRISLGRLALWMVAAFVFSIPSENGVTIPGVGSLSRLIGVAAFVAGLASVIGRDRVRFRSPSLFLVVTALFFVWSAATIFWSVAPGVTLGRAVTFAQLGVLVWLVHQLVRTDRELAFLQQAFVLGCYVLIGVGLSAFLGTQGSAFRNVGGFNANGFAIVSALAIPMAWGLAVRRVHGWLRVLNVVYPLFAIAAVVLAASRGGLLTALVALLIVPLTLGRLSLVRRLLLFASIAAITTVAFTFVPQAFPNLQQNLERLAETDEELLGGTLTGRTQIWAAGLEVYRGAPIVGVGAGGFNTAVTPVLGESKSPHNAFLSVAVGTGTIGLLLYVGLVIVAFVGIIANPDRRWEHLVQFLALVVALAPTNSDNDKFAWFILASFAAVRPVLVVIGRPTTAATPPAPSTPAGTPASSPLRRTTT